MTLQPPLKMKRRRRSVVFIHKRHVSEKITLTNEPLFPTFFRYVLRVHQELVLKHFGSCLEKVTSLPSVFRKMRNAKFLRCNVLETLVYFPLILLCIYSKIWLPLVDTNQDSPWRTRLMIEGRVFTGESLHHSPCESGNLLSRSLSICSAFYFQNHMPSTLPVTYLIPLLRAQYLHCFPSKYLVIFYLQE